MRSGSSLRDGFASFFNNPTDSVTSLSRDGRGPKNLWSRARWERRTCGEEGRARVAGALGSYHGGKRRPLVSLMTKFC